MKFKIGEYAWVADDKTFDKYVKLEVIDNHERGTVFELSDGRRILSWFLSKNNPNEEDCHE